MDVKWSLRAKFKDVLVKKVFFHYFWGLSVVCVFSVFSFYYFVLCDLCFGYPWHVCGI